MKAIRKILILFVIFPVTLSCSSDPIEQLGDLEKIIEEIAKADTTSQKPGNGGIGDNDDNTNTNDPFKGYAAHIMDAYKRAQQFVELKWNSMAPIPIIGGTTCDTGEHTGVLYSLANEYNKYVGFDVSIKTYMSALHNKHSLLYTENISKKNSTSSYNIKYFGNDSYCAPYMGTVCSFFVSYILGQKIPYHVYEYEAMEKLGIIEKVADQSVNGIQLMDLVLESGHVAIITNITRDKNRELSSVFWTEAVNPFTRTIELSTIAYKNRIGQKKGVLYRFKDWDNSLAYKASEFVAAYGESISDYHYNDDICTFAGDCACFREGDIIVIDYRKGSYTEMELYKDNQLLETIPLSKNADDYAINLTDKNLPYGNYKARLVNGKYYSDYTYFEILQTEVSIENYGDHQKVNFHSENGKPIYIQFCSRTGTSYGKYLLTEDDLINGYAFTEANNLLELYRDATKFGSDVYVKVFFEGQYGRVTNHFLKTDIK